MRIFKKVVVLSVAMCFITSNVSLAAPDGSSKDSSSLPIQYELKMHSDYNMKDDMEQTIRVYEKEELFPVNDSKANIMADVPLEGDAKVVSYTDVGTAIYTSEQQSGTLHNIKYAMMNILGKAFGPVETIILELVDFSLSTVDYNKLAKAETRYSYSYPGKKVQIYTNRAWSTRYEVISRFTWPHTWGYWTPQGSSYPKTYAISKTPEQGYNTPFIRENAPNYTNDTTLIKRARENYQMYDGYWKYPLYWYN